ncbi:hypothetical protein Pan97_37540 [Bremerella volcania]|uniref:HEAT repeat protein n=1 Tax=Bremerella volcania TaxID=2527984 RepID=A0A518CBV0_9BACT|nr:hypothetical protein [Bremerella volcania]QDU76699.1 hypothetical protein Pan97_37540 [Bremerella volcania]
MNTRAFIAMILLGLMSIELPGQQPFRYTSREEDDRRRAEQRDAERQQRPVLPEKLLQKLDQIRKSGELSGSGGGKDTAYYHYHILFYDVLRPNVEAPFDTQGLQPGMTRQVLSLCGSGDAKPPQRFPYETVLVLSELRKNQMANELPELAEDASQPTAVRYASIFALYRAGEPFRTDTLISILEKETKLENRIIGLIALMHGGEKSVPTLLKNLEDENVEVATAAACGLYYAMPPEAVPLLDKAYRRHGHGSPPLLILSALQRYENEPCREVLAGLVQDTLDGKLPIQNMYRILSAFEGACDQDWQRVAGIKEFDPVIEAEASLQWYAEHRMKRDQQRQTLSARLANARKQLEVAQQVEALRHEEYKRLLLLQGDEIVTAEMSQAAHAKWQTVKAEVAQMLQEVNQYEAQLKGLDAGER